MKWVIVCVTQMALVGHWPAPAVITCTHTLSHVRCVCSVKMPWCETALVALALQNGDWNQGYSGNQRGDASVPERVWL